MPAPLVNFGATFADARLLVLDTGGDGERVGSQAPRVPDATVTGWLAQGAGEVSAEIIGWERLPPETYDQIVASAKGLTALYAGSLLADVTHPQQAGKGNGIGDALRTRYERGVTSLSTMVSNLLAAMDNTVAPSQILGGTVRSRPPSGWERVGF